MLYISFWFLNIKRISINVKSNKKNLINKRCRVSVWQDHVVDLFDLGSMQLTVGTIGAKSFEPFSEDLTFKLLGIVNKIVFFF